MLEIILDGESTVLKHRPHHSSVIVEATTSVDIDNENVSKVGCSALNRSTNKQTVKLQSNRTYLGHDEIMNCSRRYVAYSLQWLSFHLLCV